MPRATCDVLVISADQNLVQSMSAPLAAAGYTLHWLSHVFAPSTRIFAQNVQTVVFDLESASDSDASCLGRLLQITTCRCLVITGRGRTDQRIMALRAGAAAVLSRPVQMAETIARLRLLVSATPADRAAPALFLAPGLVIDSESSVIACQDCVINLTAQETLVLRVLAEFANRLVSYTLLCDALGLRPDKRGILALRQAVARLRRKLSSRETSSLHIVAERHRGYTLLVRESSGDSEPLLLLPAQSAGLPMLPSQGAVHASYG